DQVPGTLRRHQGDVDALRRLDVAEPDVEAVAEEQGVTGHQVRLDRIGVDLALGRVRGQHHDQVCLFASLVRAEHPKALRLGLGPALAALRQPDAYVDA